MILFDAEPRLVSKINRETKVTGFVIIRDEFQMKENRAQAK